MREQEPVRVPKDVLDELESVRRYVRTDAPDIPTLRYVAMETGKPARTTERAGLWPALSRSWMYYPRRGTCC